MDEEICSNCGGFGIIATGGGKWTTNMRCPDCKGTGRRPAPAEGAEVGRAADKALGRLWKRADYYIFDKEYRAMDELLCSNWFVPLMVMLILAGMFGALFAALQ